MNLQEALKQWQEALRLQDWDITAKIVPKYEYRCTAKYDSRAENTIDSWHKHSSIKIAEDDYDYEESLVHELTHLLLHGLERTIAAEGGEINGKHRLKEAYS